MDYIINRWFHFKYAFLHEQKEKKTYFPSKEKMSVLQTTSQTSSTCQKDFQEDRNPLPSKQQTQSKFGGKQRKQHTAWFYLIYFSVYPEHIAAFVWPTDFRTSEQNFSFKMQEYPIRKKPK